MNKIKFEHHNMVCIGGEYFKDKITGEWLSELEVQSLTNNNKCSNDMNIKDKIEEILFEIFDYYNDTTVDKILDLFSTIQNDNTEEGGTTDYVVSSDEELIKRYEEDESNKYF